MAKNIYRQESTIFLATDQINAPGLVCLLQGTYLKFFWCHAHDMSMRHKRGIIELAGSKRNVTKNLWKN